MAPTTRGFTDHEGLTDFGLVHMNGRIYNPTLGRFISADPFVDGTDDPQGYNRYSYVSNNPLSHTDPSGFFKLKEILPAVVAVVATAVVIVATAGSGAPATAGFWAKLGYGLANATWQQAGIAGAVGGFGSGFSGSLLNGGSIGDAFRAGAIGAAIGGMTAIAAQGIGHFFDEAFRGTGIGSDSFSNWGGRTLAHGVVGGVASEAGGGEFRHGFYASVASTGFMHSSPGVSLMGSRHIAVRIATAAVIGGTASILGGGKFANGATTAAFQHLFNQEATRPSKEAEGILFLRLNYLNSEERTDFNSKAWGKLILSLKEELVAAGTIKEHQLNFALALTEAGAVRYLESAKQYNWEVILSSHGHPSHDDYKSMFGRDVYKRLDFIRSMNKNLGSDFLSVKNTWYSCDALYGARPPIRIFNDDAKEHITWRLMQINSKR